METLYSDPEIDNILGVEGNSLCNDCRQPDPKWASVNNAVFLCTKCARKHQKLGRVKSTIKSIEVDNLEKGEILLLKNGGNKRFQKLLDDYRIPQSTNAEYKYSTKAAKYYRRLLSNEVREVNTEIFKPDLKTGIQLDDDEDERLNVPSIPIQSKQTESIPQPRPLTSEEVEETDFNDMLKSIGTMFNEISNNINDTIKEKKWDIKLKEKSEVALQFAIDSKDFIKGKSKEVVQSEVFQSIKLKAENGIDLIKEKASEMMENSHYFGNDTHSQSHGPSSNSNSNPNNNNVYISIFDNNTPGGATGDINIS